MYGVARRPTQHHRGMLIAASMATALLATQACTTTGGAGDNRLVAVHNALRALGLGEVGHIAQGSLAQGNAIRIPYDLEAQCYTFVAFGADGARDVDLTITDANNTRVASDNTTDSEAAVQFCPTARGRYTLTLRMAQGSGTYSLGQWRGSVRGGGGAAAGAGDSEGGTCPSPIPIQLGQTVTGDTRHAHNNQSGSCNEGEAPELVYQLTLERRQLVTVAAEQDYDGLLYIRQNCEDPNSEVPGACNDDDGDTSHSRIVVALEPGTYFIFEDGYADGHGSFTLTVTGTDVPSTQEICQNAPVLAAGQAVAGQTSGEPNLFQAGCANNAPGPDRVYRLEVPQESRVQVFQESDYDGVLYIRRACADRQSEVACNDDAEDAQHSRINTVLPQGTYYVFTDGFSAGSSGNFTLEADLAPLAGGSGLAGDTCQDAPLLTSGQSVEGNTLLARDDVQSPCGAAQDGFDMVYRLDVTTRSHVKLWFDNADLGSNAVIYLTRTCASGPPAPNAAIACRAGAIHEDAGVDAVLEPGHYFVVVDSAQPRGFGRFHLHARIDDVRVLERACHQAPILRNHHTVTGTTSGDDRFQATCAGGARSPETLYRLPITRRSFVRLALTATQPSSGPPPRGGGPPNAHYDPAIYIRANCVDASSERACNDDAGDVQHSLIETTLEPGTYTVFVDGFSNNNSGSYSLEVTINPQ